MPVSVRVDDEIDGLLREDGQFCYPASSKTVLNRFVYPGYPSS
jgi:hypothetical protein